MAGGQERQLIGDVRGVLVQALEHEAVGKRSGGVEQAVGHGQADGKPALGILAVCMLLTAAAQVIVSRASTTPRPTTPRHTRPTAHRMTAFCGSL